MSELDAPEHADTDADAKPPSRSGRVLKWTAVIGLLVGSVYLNWDNIRGLARRNLPGGLRRAVSGPQQPPVIERALDEQAVAELEIAGPHDWTSFRGPGGQGVVAGVSLATDWQADPPEQLWRRPIGPGNAQYVVAGDLALTAAQVEDRDTLLCQVAATGEPVWSVGFDEHSNGGMGGPGPRATPTVSGERVVAFSSFGQLRCVDLRTGKPQWTAEPVQGGNVMWGHSGSPAVHEGVAYVNPGAQGNGDGYAVQAYRLDDGELLWHVGDDKAGYASPAVMTLAGKEQLVVFHGAGLSGYGLADGEELWRTEQSNETAVNAAQPLEVGDDLLFASNAYSGGVAALYRIGGGSAERLWQQRRFQTRFSGAVHHDGHVYGLAEGIASCIRLSDGKVVWKDRGEGVNFGEGHLLRVGAVVLAQCQSGDVVLFAADPADYRQLASLKAVEGRTWNAPCLAGDLLLVRNSDEAACYRLPTTEP